MKPSGLPEIGGGRGQAQGLPLPVRAAGGGGKGGACGDLTGRAGRGLAESFRLGTCWIAGAWAARHVVGGGVAGAEPPHKGGPTRPDRTTAVVSGQIGRYL